MKKYIIDSIACLVVLSNLYSQNSLNIKDKTGTNTAFNIRNVRKLTFSGNRLYVNSFDQSTLSFNLSDISNVNFRDISTRIVQSKIKNPGPIALFPNPAIDFVNIQLSNNETNATIEIINIEGKIVYRKNVGFSDKMLTHKVDLTTLKKGVYICRIMNKQKISAIKFLITN